jgi:hypothetical protein
MSTDVSKKSVPDFDTLMALALNDPDKFESERRKFIESFINNVPADKQQRLKGLQWQIDQGRKLARTPMASCIAISNMMWDSLYRLCEHQRDIPERLNNAPSAHEQMSPQEATILPFHAPRN